MASTVDVFMAQTANLTGAFTVTETCRAHGDDKAKARAAGGGMIEVRLCLSSELF